MIAPRPVHFVAALACGLALAITCDAAAQSVEQFYKGRTVSLLVGTSPGGINDISARLVARHLARFIPGAPSIVGATYFPPKLNAIFAKYFRDAGFTVRGMEGIDVPFDKVQELASQQVYAHIKRNFLKAKGADAIYMLGSGWRTLDIIETLEQDLQVPVVHPVTARVWEIQKRLHVRQPRRGYGHMLEALP